ncbi:hypothetical protein [Micromonospora sediminimaris]|uniref:Uncharacterized protein n=1 Tax=Micromonospora sediminimaris TaxID=547162 RepID=A0A9W5XKW9_9ACTN|nr:hypothetical protein [Micromonospora sediminimaris]GIJ34412.1 hypothetical protein Vse01_35600 [Micromonospora sediminimaris]SFD30602.1 hypothetical protein SAMN05216284_114187 [Micromonospora sediminimaris]
MSKVVIRAAAVAGAAGTLVAVFGLPWAWYGDRAVRLTEFPGWAWYVGAAVLLNLVTAWTIADPGRRGWLPLVAGGLGGVTIVAAVAVMTTYADVFLGPVVPAVRPSLGPGGPVAVLAGLAGLAAVAGSRYPQFSRSS